MKQGESLWVPRPLPGKDQFLRVVLTDQPDLDNPEEAPYAKTS